MGKTEGKGEEERVCVWVWVGECRAFRGKIHM